MKELKRHREQQDIIWSKMYNMLSEAGFELIVPDEHQEEFKKRQEYLEENL